MTEGSLEKKRSELLKHYALLIKYERRLTLKKKNSKKLISLRLLKNSNYK